MSGSIHEDPNGAATDVSFRMSKKIAQLTKVIHQLNCRCEDNDSMLRNVSDTYEGEIADIMTDARTKLEGMKVKLDASRDDTKIKEVIATMTRQHQQEKLEAMRQFDDFKARVAQSEATAKRQMEERIAGLTADVNKAKEDFQAKLVEIERRASKSQGDVVREMQEARRLKDQELQDLIVQYNDKYKAMLAEQLGERDKLERQLETKEKEWQERWNKATAEWSRSEAGLKQQLSSSSEANKKLLEQLGQLQAKDKALEQEKLQLTTEATKSQHTIERLFDQVKRLSDQLEGQGRSAGEQSQALLALERALRDRDDANAALRSQVSSLTDTVGKKHATVVALENDLEMCRANIQALQRDLQRERDLLASTSADSSTMGNEISRLREEANASALATKREQARAEAAEAQVATCQRDLAKARDHLAQVTLAHSAALEALQAKHAQELKDAIDRAAQTGDGAVAATRRQMEDLMARQKAAIEAQHTKDMEELGKQHDAKLKAALAAQLAEQEQIRLALVKKQETDLQAWRVNLEGLQATAASQSTSLADEIRSLKDQLLAANDQVLKLGDRHRSESDAWSSERIALLKRLDGLLNEIALLRGDGATALREASQRLEAATKEHAVALVALESDRECRLTELKTKHQAELDRLRQEAELRQRDGAGQLASEAQAKLQTELARQREQLERAAASQLAAKEKEWQLELGRREEKLAKLTAEFEKLQAVHRALEATHRALEATRQEELAAADEKLSRLGSSATFASRALEERFQREKASLEEALRAVQDELKASRREADAALEALKAAMLVENERLARDAQAALEESAARFRTQMKLDEQRKDEERTRSLAEQQAKMSGEHQRSMDRHASEMEEVQLGRAAIERELKKALGDLRNVNAALSDEQQRHGETKNAFKEATRTAAEETESLKQKHEERLKKVLADLRQQHDEATAALTQSHNEKLTDWQQKQKAFQRYIADLEYRIANRESRAEDVAKINELMKSLREKDEALIRSYQESQKYKLDLINKESTYNKVFGRQPTVDAQQAQTLLQPGGGADGTGASNNYVAMSAAAATTTAPSAAQGLRSAPPASMRPPISEPAPRAARAKSFTGATPAAEGSLPQPPATRLPDVGAAPQVQRR